MNSRLAEDPRELTPTAVPKSYANADMHAAIAARFSRSSASCPQRSGRWWRVLHRAQSAKHKHGQEGIMHATCQRTAAYFWGGAFGGQLWRSSKDGRAGGSERETDPKSAGGRPKFGRNRPHQAQIWTTAAATGIWFRHRAWLCCRRAPLPLRLQHLYAIAGAAFLCGVGVWKLSAEVWRQCAGRLLRAMIPYARSRGKPWREWGRPQPVWLGPALESCLPMLWENGVQASVFLGWPLGQGSDRQPCG